MKGRAPESVSALNMVEVRMEDGEKRSGEESQRTEASECEGQGKHGVTQHRTEEQE